MKKVVMKSKFNTIAIGLAIFSMFFGAGNVVYPLVSGQHACEKYPFAILGFLITSALFSFLGIFAMALFKGDYEAFFTRLGKSSGFIIIVIIIALIGPIGCLPRIIIVAYGSLTPFISEMSLLNFSIVSCVLIFLLTLHQERILDILGYILTPLLLVSLILIIALGVFCSSVSLNTDQTNLKVFFRGLLEGSQTMDFLAAFIFSPVVFKILKNQEKSTSKIFLKAGAIGMFFLGLIYVGFICVAACHSQILQSIDPLEILGVLANNILGKWAGIVISISVALACLTTAIALAAAFSDFLCEKVFRKNVSYIHSLIITLLISISVSFLNFSGIKMFLETILEICYPAIFVLTVCNIAYKLFGFKIVKTPVAAMFVISLVYWLVVNKSLYA
jgi:branched-chain amino acid:cation transporter, LIVCS family